MRTGDAWSTAAAVARDLGLDEVIAGVRPDPRADVVARLPAEGRPQRAAAAQGPALTGFGCNLP